MTQAGPPILPEAEAAADELERRGYGAPEPGWAVIALAVVREAAEVDPQITPTFKSKWGELRVEFLPKAISETHRGRLAGVAERAGEASRVTCQVCGRMPGSVDWEQEVVEVLCAAHRAAARSALGD
jgi:hypothetical protein